MFFLGERHDHSCFSFIYPTFFIFLLLNLFFDFSPNHGGISVELITTKKAILPKELLDMAMYRQRNVRDKSFSAARKKLIFDYFHAKLCRSFFETSICSLSGIV